MSASFESRIQFEVSCNLRAASRSSRREARAVVSICCSRSATSAVSSSLRSSTRSICSMRRCRLPPRAASAPICCTSSAIFCCSSCSRSIRFCMSSISRCNRRRRAPWRSSWAWRRSFRAPMPSARARSSFEAAARRMASAASCKLRESSCISGSELSRASRSSRRASSSASSASCRWLPPPPPPCWF